MKGDNVDEWNSTWRDGHSLVWVKRQNVQTLYKSFSENMYVQPLIIPFEIFSSKSMVSFFPWTLLVTILCDVVMSNGVMWALSFQKIRQKIWGVCSEQACQKWWNKKFNFGHEQNQKKHWRELKQIVDFIVFSFVPLCNVDPYPAENQRRNMVSQFELNWACPVLFEVSWFGSLSSCLSSP